MHAGRDITTQKVRLRRMKGTTMANRKTAPPGFYTAKDAVEKIGIPTTSFYNLVRAGTLKGVVLPGRKEAVYPKIDIDRYARAIKGYIDLYSTEKLYWNVALAEDIPDIRELVASACGGMDHTVPA